MQYINYEEWDCKQQRVTLKVGKGLDATQALFYEFPSPHKETATYTLKNQDVEYKGTQRISAYLVYMHSVDEYDAAIKLVGSMKHWRKLCSLSWFMEGVPEYSFEGLEQWREDMRLRDESLAKRQLMEAAHGGNVNAQKLLFGTPSKKTKEEKPVKKDTSAIDSIVQSISRARK